MIAWFARNDVAANLLLISIVTGGLYCLHSVLKLEIFPEVEPDVISVSVPLRGATPEDIELGVAIRIEESVQDLEGIDKITSRSVEGFTSVRIEVDSDYEPRDLLNDIKNRVDSINTFPADTEKPVVSLAQHTHEVISVVVAGDYSEAEIRRFAEQIRDDLLRVKGITQVELDAVRKYEISIEASQDQLRDFNLSLADIARAIQRSSLDISAGNVRTDGGDVLIRSKGQAYRRAEFEDIVVKTNADGSIIRVADIASVNDGFEEVSLKTGFNGNFAGLIQVYRIGGQSAIEIADKVKDYINARQASLPVGMILSYWDDDSEYLKARLNTLISNGIQGGILVIILLAMFLTPSVAFWVFIGIPVSFLGALILMSLSGFSINIMSLFGFIIVLGIVVDDAIVTGENVYSRMREGGDPLDASIRGTKQVAIPVTFGVLTTIAAFSPLAFIEGRMGDFMGPIPAVVIPCLLFSLIESKLVLPAHLKHIKVNNGNSGGSGFSRFQRRFANGFEQFVLDYYRPLLKFSVKHRYSVLTTFIGVLLLAVSLVMSGWAKFTFFPRVESDNAAVTLTMPVGTPFDVTDRHMQRITEAAFELQQKYTNGEGGEPIIRDILSTTGSAGRMGRADYFGQVLIETVPSDERIIDIRTKDLVNEWRKIIGKIPGAESLTFRAELIRTGDPVDIQFSANSLETLSEVGEQVKERLATYPTVFDIADSLSDGKEELQIELTQQGHVLGLTRAEIVSQVSQAFRGFEAQRIQRGRDDVRVIVRLPKEERSTTATLEEYLITAPDGRKIPLSHVATMKPGKGPATITRIDRYRTMNVTADIDKAKTNMKVLQEDLDGYLQQLLINYPSVSYNFEGEAKHQRESFGSLQWGLVILLFAIYVLLALPLKSYIEPLIVMSVIPFGVIGAIGGHWIMGRDLSFLSILGLMALTGVVVNDSLVLVDFINQKKKQGMSLVESVLNAGIARFRPVLLTSLTTFFGLLPLMFEKSVQAQFLIPMGISLGFGILFATAITLIMIPANIMIVDDITKFLNSFFSDTPKQTETA
jgi:multidrug efflux pump subunit AcrB